MQTLDHDVKSSDSDRVTVLTCAHNLKAAKIHSLSLSGGWNTRQYDSMLYYEARVVEVDGFAQMVRLLRGLSLAPRSLIIRELPGEGANPAKMKRQIATTCGQPLGLRMVCADIDGLDFASLGIEVDPTSRESLEAAVRKVSDYVMPEPLRGCRLYYQWSNSAGVKPWDEIRLHLWYWLDRRVCAPSLKLWAKKTPGVDPSLYDRVRVHYTAKPIFRDHFGNDLPDIMGVDEKGSLRSGVLEGSQPIAPPEWLDRPTHDAHVIAEEARIKQEKSDALNERRRQRAEARGADYEPVTEDELIELQREAMANPLYRDGIHRAALRLIKHICRDLESPPSTDRHNYIRGRIRRAFGARDVIDPRKIAAMLLPSAVQGLLVAGRSATVARGEADRLIENLIFDEAAAPAIVVHTKGLPDKAPTREANVDPEDEHLTPKVKRLATDTPSGVPWACPAGGWFDRDQLPVSTEDGYAFLDAAVLGALNRAEITRTALVASAGSGKSFAAKKRALIDVARDGHKACLVVPTHKLALEAQEDLIEMATDLKIEVAPSRRGPVGDNPATCFMAEEVGAAAQCIPGGGVRFCRKCELHPRNTGTLRDACPFMRAVLAQREADIVIKTHALAVLEGDLEPDEEEFAFYSMVIDEDPSGAMTHTAGLDMTAIQRLVACGDLEIADKALGSLARLMAESLVSGRRIKTEEIREQVDTSALIVKDEYKAGEETIKQALEDQSPLERLQSGIPWRSIAGLFEAVQSDWGACVIHKGALQVSHTMPIEMRRAQHVLYLDATASEARVKQLLGTDGVVINMRSEAPSCLELHWIPIDSGVGSRLLVEGSRRVPLIQAATWLKYGADSSSLIITSKRNRSGDTWTGDLLEHLSDQGTAVIHHRGPAGRGVNCYKDKRTVIVDAWHVPQHAVEANAYAWASLAGEDWKDEAVRTKWINESRAQMEGAEVIQEISRIRPLLATDGKPKRIVIIDKRDPRSIGLPVTHVIDPDRLVYETTGLVTDMNTAPAILARLCDVHGGHYCPAADSRRWMKLGEISAFSPEIVARQNIISDILRTRMQIDVKSDLSPQEIIRTWLGNHGGPDLLARMAGVQVTYFATPGGGHPMAIFHTKQLTREDVEAWLRPIGIKQFRIKGQEVWYLVRGIEHALKVACCEIEIEDDWKVEDIIRQLANRIGRSSSTVRREINRLRSPDETFEEAIRRIIAEVLAFVASGVRDMAQEEPRLIGALKSLKQRLDALYADTPLQILLEPPCFMAA